MRPLKDLNDRQFGQLKAVLPFDSKPPVCSALRLHLNMSLQDQIELRSLQSYVAACREAIRSIRMEIELFTGQEWDHEILAGIRGRLVKICREADGRQFDDLYQIALAIQKQLLDLDHGIQKWSVDLAKAIDEGLTVLSILLEECEDEFRRRLKVSDVLIHLSQPAG